MADVLVANESDVPLNTLKAVEASGEKYVLYHLPDGFFATQAKCPHLGAPLAKGKIVGDGKIQCKFHRAEFDIRDGKACKWANFPPGIQALNFIRGEKDLATYTCSVKDGKVYISL
ncbi:MAG: Rieske (2Fe-2S) protein [Gammaproteobacteria bacterium]|nr:Rieske (2Fe-2S) protein [Gammaproteobacteria bacterium]